MKTKLPISEVMLSPSAIVPHDAATNAAMDAAKRDCGLQPNGITIEDMRECPELYDRCDDLDRPARAAAASGKLAKDVKNVVNQLRSHDRNKPKNSL